MNLGSIFSSCGLLSLGLGFLSPQLRFLFPGILALFGTTELLAQISVAQMKSAAFLKALTNVVSFFLAKENLKHLLLRPFRKEVYAIPSSRSGIQQQRNFSYPDRALKFLSGTGRLSAVMGRGYPTGRTSSTVTMGAVLWGRLPPAQGLSSRLGS